MYATTASAMAAYVALVTQHDPTWRSDDSTAPEGSTTLPSHIKSQLKASGINVIGSSEDEEGEEEDLSDSEVDSDLEAGSAVDKRTRAAVVPPVKSIFEAVRVGRRYGMYLPKQANACDPETKVSVLMMAVDSQQAEVVDALLQAGADVLWVDSEDGSTPLHCAALLGSERICRALLQAGANPLLKDEDGMTCVDIAQQEHWVEGVQCMQEFVE